MIVLGAALVLIGVAFCFLAALGLLRFPDVFTRMHAASKAGVLGSGLVLLGSALTSGDATVVLKALVGVIFLVLSGPVAAHLLARAALKSGTKPIEVMNIDADAHNS